MKSLSHFLEYCGLRAAEFLVCAVPRRCALAAGAAAGTLLFYAGVYRKVVERNFDHVGMLDGEERRKTLRALYANIGRYGSDFLRAGRDSPPYAVNNLDEVDRALARGKGMIAVLAHFGNWELLAAIFGSHFSDLNVLARPMHNPLVEKWLLAKRKRAKVTPIYASGALRRMLTVLNRNGIIAMLIDQYAADQGTPVLFLGKPANTVRTVAGLFQKTDCGIVLPFALLKPDGSYNIVIEAAPAIDVSRDSKDEFIAAVQTSHNAVLSRWIRQYPEHYFGWFHRRFKDSISY
ncbi:MAG TPA: lysophospholipid acyltransferase family protein [Chitinivibrionales bacterium]|nr:lysophospholipid acyltransferase family protein [Chitinivibrionales bacterium]